MAHLITCRASSGSLSAFRLLWLLLFLLRNLRQLLACRPQFLLDCVYAACKIFIFLATHPLRGWPTVARCPRLRSRMPPTAHHTVRWLCRSLEK